MTTYDSLDEQWNSNKDDFKLGKYKIYKLETNTGANSNTSNPIHYMYGLRPMWLWTSPSSLATFGKETKKEEILHIATLNWSVAFTTFMAVSTHFDPSYTFPMATLASIILALARDVDGQVWLPYMTRCFATQQQWTLVHLGTTMSKTSGWCQPRQPTAACSQWLTPLARQENPNPSEPGSTVTRFASAGTRTGAPSQDASFVMCTSCATTPTSPVSATATAQVVVTSPSPSLEEGATTPSNYTVSCASRHLFCLDWYRSISTYSHS